MCSRIKVIGSFEQRERYIVVIEPQSKNTNTKNETYNK